MLSNNYDIEMFGSNQLYRRDSIQRLLSTPIRMYLLKFRGVNTNLPVISVKLSLPVYRIGNRRTKTLQEEYLIKHPSLSSDFFTTDVDSISVQKAQDDILRDLIDDKDLYDVFTNPKVQQDEPIICTRDGVVINGNRRLCAWRKLFIDDPVKYSHFQSVEIVLLPSDADEDDINNVERDLQIKRSIKSEYSWHAKANMIRMDFEKVHSYDELSQMYDMSKADLQNAMDCYAYAKSYLDSIGKTGQWSLVDKHEYAFLKIIKERKRIKSIPEQKVFEACSSALLQANVDQVSNRRYDVISKIAKNLDAIIEVAKRDFAVHVSRDVVKEDPFGMTKQTNSHLDLYCIEEACRSPENLQKTVEIINAVLDATATRNRDENSSRLLLDDLISISTELISVKNSDLDDRQECFSEVRNQLSSISETCEYIRNWVEQHESNS